MQFSDSEIQRLLRGTARSFLADKYPWERLSAGERGDEQRTRQARPSGDRDRVQLRPSDLCLTHCLLGHRLDGLDVTTRSEFWYHSAETRMNIMLGIDDP